MLLQINPQQSIAYVVQILKGGSSKVIREEFPELEEFLWGDSLWSDGYFAESVGVCTRCLAQEVQTRTNGIIVIINQPAELAGCFFVDNSASI